MTASASPGDGPLAEVVESVPTCDCGRDDRTDDHEFERGCDAWTDDDDDDAAIAQAVTAHAGEGGAVERAAEGYKSHRIDIEAEWNEFITQQALVEPEDADRFLALLYGWRDECVTDAVRARPVETKAAGDVLAERQRQVDKGYTPEHDDQHTVSRIIGYGGINWYPALYGPGEAAKSRVALVRAAACLLAAIERIDRGDYLPTLASKAGGSDE